MPSPDNSNTHATGAEEFVEGEIEIIALKVTGEEEVRNTLSGLDGVTEVAIDGEKVTVIYDPTRVVMVRLVAALHGAGFEARHAEAHRDSRVE
ncbi:MAG: heavy metal-associated domain-containing protein [Chthoniobacteraceae bacterium]